MPDRNQKTKQKKESAFNRILRHARERIAMDKKQYIVYMLLRAAVIVTLVRCAMLHEYESVAACALSLVLLLLPTLVEEFFYVEVPVPFQIMIYIFIFSAEILGEINHYYVRIPQWDTILHTISGFQTAAVGFSMIDLLNRSGKKINLSPLYLCMVALCFSMTVGVVWEFIENFMDMVFLMDMQKDTTITQFGTIALDPAADQNVVRLTGIEKTTIETASGNMYVIENGYLDIGLIDTMKDLFVNFIGALVFSIYGYFYLVHQDKHNAIVNNFVIRPVSKEARQSEHEKMDEVHEKGALTWLAPQIYKKEAREKLREKDGQPTEAAVPETHSDTHDDPRDDLRDDSRGDAHEDSRGDLRDDSRGEKKEDPPETVT